MNARRAMERALVRALLSGAFAATALGLSPAVGQAHPGAVRTVCDPTCHGTWCPGELLPTSATPITWDMNSCHDYHEMQSGQVVEGSLPVDAYRCTEIEWCPEGT